MVVDQQGATDRIFGALADPTRRDIVRRVMTEQASVSALAASYPMSFAAVQKHVAILERAGLITKERRGREQLVRGDIAGVRSATDLLSQYEEIWRGRIGRIDDLLAEPSSLAAPPQGENP